MPEKFYTIKPKRSPLNFTTESGMEIALAAREESKPFSEKELTHDLIVLKNKGVLIIKEHIKPEPVKQKQASLNPVKEQNSKK